MNVNRNPKMSKTVAIVIGGIAVLLILGQVAYFGLAKLFPDLVSDQQGVANSLASKVLAAQSKYHDQSGMYAKDIKSLGGFSTRGEKYRVGYASDFPTEISGLCGDCIYQEQAYKLLIVVKWLKGATVWSLDNSGELKQLESVQNLPNEFDKL